MPRASPASDVERTPSAVPNTAARTWLFAPAHEPRKLGKAAALLADGRCDRLLVDWEDAVPEPEKAAARQATADLIASLPALQRRGIAVRIHAERSAHFEADLESLEGWLIGAVMMAKAESARAVRRAATLELPLIALIETALGVQSLAEIAAADPWLRGLALGPLDLLADLGLEWTPDSAVLAAVQHQMVIAGRAAGLGCLLQGPYPDLQDQPGLRADSAAGRRAGLTGRLLLHPEQIDSVAGAFAPTPAELAQARRVLEAWQSRQPGHGALRVDGRFVDAPVVRWARDLLQRHGSPA